jgi:hypothetical protein
MNLVVLPLNRASSVGQTGHGCHDEYDHYGRVRVEIIKGRKKVTTERTVSVDLFPCRHLSLHTDPEEIRESEGETERGQERPGSQESHDCCCFGAMNQDW